MRNQMETTAISRATHFTTWHEFLKQITADQFMSSRGKYYPDYLPSKRTGRCVCILIPPSRSSAGKCNSISCLFNGEIAVGGAENPFHLNLDIISGFKARRNLHFILLQGGAAFGITELRIFVFSLPKTLHKSNLIQ